MTQTGLSFGFMDGQKCLSCKWVSFCLFWPAGFCLINPHVNTLCTAFHTFPMPWFIMDILRIKTKLVGLTKLIFFLEKWNGELNFLWWSYKLLSAIICNVLISGLSLRARCWEFSPPTIYGYTPGLLSSKKWRKREPKEIPS